MCHVAVSYSVTAVRHEVTHLHNVRPWAVIRAVDQSQSTAPSDQSQQRGLTERRGLETDSSNESFRNHLEMR